MTIRATVSLGLVVAIQLGAGAFQAPAPARVRVVPRDEAARAPGFAPVLARFRKVVQARNAGEVLALTSEAPAFSFAAGSESSSWMAVKATLTAPSCTARRQGTE
jgi:hypothetical protein